MPNAVWLFLGHGFSTRGRLRFFRMYACFGKNHVRKPGDEYSVVVYPKVPACDQHIPGPRVGNPCHNKWPRPAECEWPNRRRFRSNILSKPLKAGGSGSCRKRLHWVARTTEMPIAECRVPNEGNPMVRGRGGATRREKFAPEDAQCCAERKAGRLLARESGGTSSVDGFADRPYSRCTTRSEPQRLRGDLNRRLRPVG